MTAVGAYFFLTRFNPSSIYPKTKSSVIQLVPLPNVISNSEGRKDNRLQALLIDKTPNTVTITNAEIHGSEAVLRLPFDLKGLSMRFSYDQVLNRVNFDGHNFDIKPLK